ncbi:hypothetical protein [Vibrio ouci]|uniref:Uncharacterized protein n=1 Tax=Vibrio ouci TaxID=2499078 RepID=A0A4Y8WA14_9VIBR|nr:hypothetical protein [Vibrio ouci]TFH89228.1 hypothetical protein ELS82_23370 [Vibrio ouci]
MTTIKQLIVTAICLLIATGGTAGEVTFSLATDKLRLLGDEVKRDKPIQQRDFANSQFEININDSGWQPLIASGNSPLQTPPIHLQVGDEYALRLIVSEEIYTTPSIDYVETTPGVFPIALINAKPEKVSVGEAEHRFVDTQGLSHYFTRCSYMMNTQIIDCDFTGAKFPNIKFGHNGFITPGGFIGGGALATAALSGLPVGEPIGAYGEVSAAILTHGVSVNLAPYGKVIDVVGAGVGIGWGQIQYLKIMKMANGAALGDLSLMPGAG